MEKIKHRFIDHRLNPETEILIIGTFNPDTEKNKADFFYGRQRNFLWTLIPLAFGEMSLKGKSKEDKLTFIDKYKLDFIDLISEVEVEIPDNYNDGYLDSRVTKWTPVIAEIEKLSNLKKVCLTRKSFGDISNMKVKIDEIKNHCLKEKIPFQFLATPARFYNQIKQSEWTDFFTNDDR